MKLKTSGICMITLCFLVALAGCDSGVNKKTLAERPHITVSEVSDIIQEAGENTENKHTKQSAPTSYTINIEVNPVSRKVTTIEKILYKNQTGIPLDRIYIQFNINAFTSVYKNQPFFNEQRSRVYKYGRNYFEYLINLIEVNNENTYYELNDRYIEISLKKPLMPMEDIDIAMQFECTVPKICHRTGANGDAMWFGNFIPLIAHNENGEWQLAPYYPAGEPFVSEVANFEVTITTPEDYSVFYGSGTEKITENETNKTKTTRMTVNMVRDFAFVISNKYKTEQVVSNSGVSIYFHYYTENLAPTRISKILEVAKTAVDYYHMKIGPYPFRRIDIAETELSVQGGAEYPNMIFLDSGYVRTTINFDAVAHHAAHQWFYNAVGNNQITEAWIDEGLTTYVQSYMFESSLAVDRKMEEIYNLLSEELKKTPNNALTTDLGDFASWNEYNSVNFFRGALLFHGLHRKMGNAKFDQFLKNYYSEYSFKIATRQDMIDIASAVYGEKLDDFFESWISWRELPNL